MIVQHPMDDGVVSVLFRLPAAIWADHIAVVGDFNGWSPSATPMQLGEQFWEARLTLEAGNTYAYAYLLDGVDWSGEPARQPESLDSGTRPITFVAARRV